MRWVVTVRMVMDTAHVMDVMTVIGVAVIMTWMRMIENTGIANYTLNSLGRHTSTLALGVQANRTIRPKSLTAMNVPVGATNATRIVHFHAHRRPFLLAGLSRRRLRGLASTRTFRVYFKLGCLFSHLREERKLFRQLIHLFFTRTYIHFGGGFRVATLTSLWQIVQFGCYTHRLVHTCPRY